MIGLNGLWKITLNMDICGIEARLRKKYANGKPHSDSKEEGHHKMIFHLYGIFDT